GSAVTGLVGFGHLFRMPEIGESEATREIPCGAANGPMPSRTPAGRLLSAPPTGTVRGRRPGGELLLLPRTRHRVRRGLGLGLRFGLVRATRIVLLGSSHDPILEAGGGCGKGSASALPPASALRGGAGVRCRGGVRSPGVLTPVTAGVRIRLGCR